MEKPLQSEGDMICRICLAEECDADHEFGRELISPCRCSGSMKYVHRACLDTWRASCLNPKALLECTTCNTPFRTRHLGPKSDMHPYAQLALDIASFLAIRFAGFMGIAGLLGFWPLFVGAGIGALHHNPLLNHILTGTATALALVGSWMMVQLPVYDLRGFRVLFSAYCPKRGGGKSSDWEGAVMILVIVGLAVCLFFILKGIYRLVTDGRHEVAKALRGANHQARQKILQQYIVLNYGEEESHNMPVNNGEEESHNMPEPATSTGTQ